MRENEHSIQSRNPDVAIVGGGIAGLCTAIALRDTGHEVVVYESAEEIRATGAGLWIPPNGMAALERLGIAETLTSRGVMLDHTEIRTTAETPLISTDIASHAAELGYEHALLSIYRADLIEELVARLPDSTVVCGRECESVDTAAPTVSFTDGTTVSPSLVVGADGVGSIVRRSIVPTTPEYAGAVAFRGLTDIPVPDEATEKGTVYWGRNGSFGYSAVGPERAWWFASIAASTPQEVPELSPSSLRTRFNDFPEPVPKLIATTDPSDLIRTPLTAVPPLETWAQGQVVLIGDAAHAMEPTLSQGSAQAMEDAVSLTRSIETHGLTPRALEEYESLRKDRAENLSEMSRTQGRIARLSHPIAIRVRNLLFRMTPDTVARRQSRQMFSASM